MPTRAVLLALLGACSDYNLSEKETPEADAPGDTGDSPAPGAPGDVDVSPGRVDAGVLCGPTATRVTVSNRGGGDLTVTDLTTDGVWVPTPGLVPTVLGPAEGLEVELIGGPGDDVLVVETDDPDEPVVSVPLTSAQDEPPLLTITAPSSGTVMPMTGVVDLAVEVSDDGAPGSGLSVAWRSDASGSIGAVTGDASGVASLAWGAEDRPSGPQTLTATVVDACEHVVEESVEVCGQAGYDTEGLDLSTWTFAGDAAWDATNGWLQLTSTGTSLVGSAFQTGTATTGDNVTIAFAFYTGDGTGADGFALTALDTDRMTGTLGSAGGCLGYGYGSGCEPLQLALPGWTIEVDTFYNAQWDPTPEDHVAFMFNGDPGGVEAWAALPEMEDTGWHTMEVTVTAPRVQVAIDGTTYIDQDIPGFYAFPAYVGFSAATGGQTNLHLIDALTVTEFICEEP